MAIITNRTDAQPLITNALADYYQSGRKEFVKKVHDTILKRKIKYPILEFIAVEFYNAIDEEEQIAILDDIVAAEEMGSEVIAGKILQLRLPAHYNESISKAVAYIIAGANWLPCDTVGERVLGHALLTEPEKTIPVLKELSQHKDKWVVRSVGVAVHYAVKKGLKKVHVEEMFSVLLSLADTTDFHTKKGIGWAAKTTSKFHPDIIKKYELQIADKDKTKQWFRTKVKIGLGRTDKYAHRYTS